MNTLNRINPIGNSLNRLALAVALAAVLGSAQAAIPVGSSGSGTITFDAPPAATEWTTVASIPGNGGTAVDLTGLDTLVQTLAATGITAPMGTVAVDPVGTTTQDGKWNSAALRLTSRAGTSAATCFMATLLNTSGAAINEMDINFTLSGSAPASEDPGMAGYALYYSLTGGTNSWQRVGVYGTLGAVSVTHIPLSGPWADAANLYVLWVDDNGNGGGDGWYGFDDVNIAPSVPLTAPIGLTATPGNANVDLAWTAFFGATGYNVKLWNGASYDTISTNQPGTTYTHSGLTNGTTYQYVVSAMTGLVESDNSAEVSATPATPPPVPGGVTGLALWLDAAQLTGLSDGATVDTWTDVSGLGNNAAKTAGSPIYKTGVLNAQPVVRFDGNSSFTTANLSAQFPSATTGFIVTTINSDNDYTLVRANNGVDEWWRFGFGGQSYPGFFRSSRLNAYCPMPNSGSHLFAITSSASAWEMSINGASQGVAGGAYSAAGALVIGNGSSGGGLTGDIAEVLIYNRVLSGSEADLVGGYLATKYGLSTTYGAPPTVLSFTPRDGDTTATESDLVATFNELIAIGTGDITIKNLTDSTQTVITLPDSQVSVSGAVLTINPTADLLAGKNYAVQIAAGAVKDLADLPFAGILNDTTWNFAAAAPTATITTVVSSGSPSIYGDSVTFTATVDPIPTGGTVQFKNNGSNLGAPVPVTAGVATYPTSMLGVVGPNEITAEYTGNFQFAASNSASISQVVNKAPLSVTAQNLFRFQNAANPDPLPQQITGFKNGQTLGTSGVTGTPALSTTAVFESIVGDYPITCDVTGMSADNYSFTPQNGTLTVLPASAAPPVTTDLKLHLNASQLTGLSDGDAVTHWADMSGMFNNATTSAGTPIYKTNVLNGNPVIRFDDSSALTTADLSAQFPSAATVFIVTTLNNDDGYTLVKANPGVDEHWRFYNSQSYPAVFRASRLEEYCIMPNTGSHLFAITSSASAWEMSINGASQGVAGGNYNSGGALVIGNGSSGGGLNGDIAEVLIYSRVLTSEETNVVGSYLASKYGLTTSYGASGFSTWASTNAGGGLPSEDFDNDGVENGIEYFMGETGSSSTAMPGLDATNTVSWTMDPAYQGTYEVQTSPDLVEWTNVDPKPVPSGGKLSYTLPTGAVGGKSFVRLLVTPAP